jgi:hypothetical protein
MRLIQIVPGITPQLDGIGDYALQLARRLRDNHGIVTSFLVGNPDWRGSDVEGFPVSAVTHRSAQSLVQGIDKLETASGQSPVPLLAQFGVTRNEDAHSGSSKAGKLFGRPTLTPATSLFMNWKTAAGSLGAAFFGSQEFNVN